MYHHPYQDIVRSSPSVHVIYVLAQLLRGGKLFPARTAFRVVLALVSCHGNAWAASNKSLCNPDGEH
jgi:hypothetical protein